MYRYCQVKIIFRFKVRSKTAHSYVTCDTNRFAQQKRTVNHQSFYGMAIQGHPYFTRSRFLRRRMRKYLASQVERGHFVNVPRKPQWRGATGGFFQIIYYVSDMGVVIPLTQFESIRRWIKIDWPIAGSLSHIIMLL